MMLQSLNRVEKQIQCLGMGKIKLDDVLLQMIIHQEFSKGSANTEVSDGNNPLSSQSSRSGSRTRTYAAVEDFPTGTANDRSTSEPPLPRSRAEIIPDSTTAGSVAETYTPITPIPTPEKHSSGSRSQNASPRTSIKMRNNRSSGRPRPAIVLPTPTNKELDASRARLNKEPDLDFGATSPFRFGNISQKGELPNRPKQVQAPSNRRVQPTPPHSEGQTPKKHSLIILDSDESASEEDGEVAQAEATPTPKTRSARLRRGHSLVPSSHESDHSAAQQSTSNRGFFERLNRVMKDNKSNDEVEKGASAGKDEEDRHESDRKRSSLYESDDPKDPDYQPPSRSSTTTSYGSSLA
jgi:hypothetical protein